MKYLYKYPQAEFPYTQLVEENRRRGKDQPEFELLDTGVFQDNRYFDVFVEYAKGGRGATRTPVPSCVRLPEALNSIIPAWAGDGSIAKERPSCSSRRTKPTGSACSALRIPASV
jgi:hypothetical protein